MKRFCITVFLGLFLAGFSLSGEEQTVVLKRSGAKSGGTDAAEKVKPLKELPPEYRAMLDAPLLFVKRQAYMAAHIYDDWITWRPGGGIYILENPGDPREKHRIRPVIDPTTEETLGVGVYRDPDISYDGKKMIFAFKGKGNGDTSIYEIELGPSIAKGKGGTGLKRLTDPGTDCASVKPQAGLIGKGQHDVTPCYLPGGRIAFTSTRTAIHVMCFSSLVDVLHTMNGDGSDIKCISVNNQTEFDPSVLPDGRILYGRWEYVDKTALYMQSLWTVNPDGSNETAFFANNLAKPTALLDARPVPGSDLVVAALTPHNGQAVGAIAMIDPKVGKNSLKAIANFTPQYKTEMDQGLKRGPSDPWPLSKDVVLIADNSTKYGQHGVIKLVTRDGFQGVVYQDPMISCYAPMLVKPRKEAAAKPSMIKSGSPGRFLVHDIYQGMDGVERGEVKWLRVLETTARMSGIPTGGRWWNQAFLVSWQGSYDIKRFLGIVPVEKDGSAFFEAPVGKAIYFQALDKDMRLIQSQRTFVQAVAGVTRSCVGCHIKDDNAAPVNTGKRPMALKKPAETLRAELWGEGFLDYPTMVQPVLDKHCVSCHGGEKGIDAGIDLSGGWTWAFNMSYETLLRRVLTGFLNCHNGSVKTADILDPRVHGSAVAPLAELLISGHKGRIKKMTRPEVELLLAWMDGNCNYYGTWDYSQHATCKAITDSEEELMKLMDKGKCTRCHDNEIGADWVNLKHPERSRILRAPLAREGAGLGLEWCRDRKVHRPDMKLVNLRYMPPDVFRPRKLPARDSGGEKKVSFKNTRNRTYRAMLAVIREARKQALTKPRVDMPGAEITKGICRQLIPIAPPDYPATDRK